MSQARPPAVTLRRARPTDAHAITRIDAAATGVQKPYHWRQRLAEARRAGVALVAERDGRVVGHVLGEIRAWEFGSPPTGWIYAVAVDPAAQRGAVGRALAEGALAAMQEAGVGSVRTMVQRESVALLRFFRSLGFRAGPFVELEIDLEPLGGVAGARRPRPELSAPRRRARPRRAQEASP